MVSKQVHEGVLYSLAALMGAAIAATWVVGCAVQPVPGAQSPAAARQLRERIVSAQQILADHPRIGRRGRAVATRRLVMLPYVMTYREIGPDIVIVDIRHSRQAERPIPDSTQ